MTIKTKRSEFGGGNSNEKQSVFTRIREGNDEEKNDNR